MADELSGQVGSNQIAHQLRGDILSGRIPEGSRLTEAQLTKRFGVGRGLIREALQRLSLQGLLVTRPNCGAMVAPEAPREIRGLILPIRRTIEVYALRLIFEELTDADFQAWDEIVERMRVACERQDFHLIAELDIEFHHLLVQRAGQPDLLVIWETLVGRIRSHFLRIQRRCPNPLEIYEEHRDIVKAFRTGDARAAVGLLKDKIS
ncbi:MAG: GntR family transcriptional regulator [Planctomycetota bacterium]